MATAKRRVIARGRARLLNPRTGAFRFHRPVEPPPKSKVAVKPTVKVVQRVAKRRAYQYPDLVIWSRGPSTAARTLARELKCARVLGPEPIFRFATAVINWGAGPGLNDVRKAVNKLETLKCLEVAKVPCLKFTTDKAEAQKWQKKGHDVFVRRSVTGTGGAGITISTGSAAPNSALPAVPDAPLYTRNYPKTHEFRVHVFDGHVIDFVEKKAKVDHVKNTAVVTDRLVRNHDNGWIFAHEGLSTNQPARADIERICVDACRATGLLFGAVDVLAILLPGNGPRGLKSAVVCEINTAPGLECTQTIAAYREAILRKYNSLKGVR